MPIYEFLCKKCGNRFEALVSIGGEKGVSCKNCGNNDIVKLVSSFGIGGGSSKLKSNSSGCATCSATSCDSCK
jgi:putative FmdB family regulatory protein